jgi:cupin 2 domain-containing protein
MQENLKNIFEVPEDLSLIEEVFEKIFEDKKVKIERIISKGQKTKEGEWLKEKYDEFVILLQGKAILSFKSGDLINMEKGDYLFIGKDTEHRVEYTSEEPVCIWLSIFLK